MLKFMDGFDQFQGQAGNTLLTSLTSLGYSPAPGMAIASGRHPQTYALELQVTAGSAGVSWSARANSLARALTAICHNGIRWIAVGQLGLAATSEDTQSWVPVVTGITATLTCIAAGNGVVIAGGGAGFVGLSPDGQAWSQIPLPRPGIIIRDIVFAAGIFIMVGSEGAQGVIFRTTDGSDIEQVAQNIPSAMWTVGFGDGKFMAGGDNGVMRVSTDATGGIWDSKALQSGVRITGIAHGENGVWLASQGRSVYRSINGGDNWVIASNNLAPQGFVVGRIRYLSGTWIAVSSRYIYVATDAMGESFTSRYTGSSSISINDVAFSIGSLGGWAAVGSSGGTNPAFILVSIAPPTRLGRTLTTTAERVVIGFAHRATARGQILSVANLLNMNWPRGIEILGQEGTAVPIRNVWYYYEIVIDKNTQKIFLYINNHLDLEVPLPAAAQAMSEYAIQWIAENGAVARLDDIVLIDSDQSNQAALLDRIGPVQIPLMPPTADVLTEFEVVPPGMDHHDAVGSLPPNMATFIRSSTSGARDTFTSDAQLPENAGTEEVPIFAVSVLALAQKSDLDARQLGLTIGADADVVEVIDDELSTTPEYSIGIFERGPGGNPWNDTNIDGLEFGVVVRP